MTHPMLVWLEEALKEQERIALDAGPRHADDADLYVQDDDAYYPLVIGPRFVLAIVEAHRKILFYHSGSHECSGPDDNCMWIEDPEVCPTVRAIASAYRHHDGWDESWGPT